MAQNNPDIAKISVEKFDNKDQILYEFVKSEGLCENVRKICMKIGLPSSPVYGLKCLPTRENPSATFYVSEKNYHTIKHNDCLKVVFSIQYVSKRILDNISDEKIRPICFEDLLKLSVDPSFIEEIVQCNGHKTLIEIYLNDQLSSTEQLALLMTVVHLFQKGHISDASQDILSKTVKILHNAQSSNEELHYALSLLHKILMSKNSEFLHWKEQVIKAVSLSELLGYIVREDKSLNLQYSALLLINSLIRLCKGDKKLQLIKEMKISNNREVIHKHIVTRGNLEKNMEHELYVLQTFLLSLLAKDLNTEININDNNLFSKDEFEPSEEDIKRITILMDFDEENYRHSHDISIENLVSFRGQERISLASNLTETSQDSSRKSSIKSFKRATNYLSDHECCTINLLTLEALRHYKMNHHKNFYQSQIEEKVYEPGIFVTSERVVKLLAKILHIGVDHPDSRSTFYQPLAFSCSNRSPFFLELFARTMWLLSKTRREMKASTFTDYAKVMIIVEKQVKIALNMKPKDFKSLTSELSSTSFDTILKIIEQEKEDEMKNLIQNHPCIQELKIMLTKTNEEHVFQHRMTCLLTGAHFPKVLEKKTHGTIFVQLSKNNQEVMVYDIISVKTNDMTFSQKFNVADITHVVVGKNCKHSNIGPKPSLAFSLIIDHEEKIKFIAKDERTANYWVDAFNLLTGNNKRSDQYISELNDLIEMDVRLKLLELQNVSIPKHPPPVPPPPIEVKPPIKPKPTRFKRPSLIK